MEEIHNDIYTDCALYANKHLVKPILGENYRNDIMDPYESNRRTIMDLRNEYEKLKISNKNWTLISCVFMFISAILALILIY